MDEAERCGRVGYLYLSRKLVEGRPDDLMRLPEVTPPGMRRLEAECDQGAAAVMSTARALPYVDDVTIFGNALHLLLPDDVTNEQVERDLEAASRAEVTVRPISPSLEDVFVRLTKLQTSQRSGGRAA
jgi:ABC-2 type transport system ATP-binding protein